MEGEDGGDDSEFNSVTSSQNSLLRCRPFAEPNADRRILAGRRLGTGSDGGSNSTKVLGNRSSPPVDRSPILMVSPATSHDSVNGEVFRTPPEEPSLSAAADSDPKFRVSEEEPVSAPAATIGVSKSPPFGAQNVRVSGKATRFPSFLAGNVRVSGKQTASAIASGNIRVSETEPAVVTAAADGATNESTENGLPISLKDVVEALVRNSGMTDETAAMYENVTIVDILKMCGIRFTE